METETAATKAEKKSFLEILRHMGKEYYYLSAMLFLFFVSWAGCYSLLVISTRLSTPL